MGWTKMQARNAWVVAAVVTVALALGSSVPSDAASSLFSSARTVRGPAVLGGGGSGLTPRLTYDTNQTVFNITISLYNDPDGDEDPNNNLMNEEQKKYEDIIRYFADAVCEESNGAHRLGQVRIFRKGEQSGRADVVWNMSEHPRASPGGFGTAGQNIIFGDSFPDGCGTGCNYDMLGDPEGAGYTLGHEWGHYTYSLYDEYVGSSATDPVYFPRLGDTPTNMSIMNSQWNAVGGTFQWLNHSTQNNYQANTAQGRVYGKSGWDVLVQSVTADPRSGMRTAQGTRMQWTSLTGKQPTAADNWFKIELPGQQATCRALLDIIWTSNLEMQVIIDRSGSMSGSPLASAKLAAQNLVEVVPNGRTALGVVQFDNTVQQLVPITPIPDPGATAKSTIKSSIAGITAGGSTAIFDAATLALSNLAAYKAANMSNAAQIVFLLTDGEDNSSSATQSSVTAAYQAANVPLMTFGFGSAAPTGVLKQLADATGGLFFSSPTTLAEIQAAFLAANAAIGNSASLSGGTPSAPAGGGATQSFVVDSTIESFTVLVNYAASQSSVSLALTGPNGASASFTCTETSGQTSCSAQVDVATAGSWAVQAQNSSGSDITVNVDVIGVPADGSRTFDVTAVPVGGNSVTYPVPIVLSATVSQGLPITGVNLVARVTDPDGDTTTFPMTDNGKGADAIANDGTYSAVLGYQEDGVYTVSIEVDNNAGTAAFTTTGFLPSHSIGATGEAPPPQALPAITDNFTRSARTQVTVDGVVSDDHPNSPPGTAMAADNTNVPGSIDDQDDRDWFSIGPIDTSKALVVRVSNLALGMEPVLNVYRSDGTTLVGTGTRKTTLTKNGYVVVNVPAASLDAAGMTAEVYHDDAGAAQGTYDISAGDALKGDEPATLDHYKCYKTKGKGPKNDVTVTDDYESKTTRVVRKILRMCNPADKNGEGIEDVTSHLTCFKIKDAKTKPRQPKFKRATATLSNQFGTFSVKAKKPESLCVPSGKNGPLSGVLLDHYKCYTARAPAVRQTVTVADQFETKETRVLKPLLVCNPADKNSEGVRNPALRLLCYKIKEAKPKFKKTKVTMTNQFGSQSVTAKKAELLCVPSRLQ